MLVLGQVAGILILYIGREPAAPDGEALLVTKDVPLKSVAGLKG